MILDDFCLLPAWFCYVIINVRYMKSLMHIVNRCVPQKIANGAENLILQSLNWTKWIYIYIYILLLIFY
jgi:hypothetical protein